VELLKPVILPGIPALAGSVHNKEDFLLIVGERDGLTCDGIRRNVTKFNNWNLNFVFEDDVLHFPFSVSI